MIVNSISRGTSFGATFSSQAMSAMRHAGVPGEDIAKAGKAISTDNNDFELVISPGGDFLTYVESYIVPNGRTNGPACPLGIGPISGPSDAAAIRCFVRDLIKDSNTTNKRIRNAEQRLLDYIKKNK